MWPSVSPKLPAFWEPVQVTAAEDHLMTEFCAMAVKGEKKRSKMKTWSLPMQVLQMTMSSTA